jgi:HEAT repeat protein
MDGTCGRSFWRLAPCLLVLGLAGCTSFGGPFSKASGQKQVADDLPLVPSPAERIGALRQLGREAPRKKAEEKQQLALQLAESIRAAEDPLIRAEIIRTLGEYPGEASDAVLKAALDDPDAEVRVAACEVWGRRGDAAAVNVLAGALDGDLDTDVRLAAARALGRANHPAAVAPLGRALDDKDPAIQYRAVLSLHKVTGKDFGNDVNQWRQYVAGELPQSAGEPSLAQRLRNMLTF